MSLLELDEHKKPCGCRRCCLSGAMGAEILFGSRTEQSGLLDTPGMVQQEPGDPQHTQSHTSG